VAWYCDAKATPAETAASIQNIGVVCRRGGINTCLNDVALEAHNAFRRYHATPPLTLDDTVARELQLQMDEKPLNKWKGKIELCEADYADGTTCPNVTPAGKTPTAAAQRVKDINARCMDNVYEEADAAKLNELVTTDAATKAWYVGKDEFNYKNGEPIGWNDKARYARYQDFTRMMWKKATKVGFGIRGKWVIARYCDDNMAYTPATSYPQQHAWPFYPWPTRTVADANGKKFIGFKTIQKNVGKLCIKEGYNACYNEAALAAHNSARARLEGYVPLTLDIEMAKTIQALIEKAGFSGAITAAERGAYASCGENVFGLTDLSKLSDVYLTDLATDTWFEGRDAYDFAAGRPKPGSDAAAIKKMEQF
jgi:uncharacterized protein YkwD